MAIRKDIDDMLNTLNSDTQPKSSPKKLPPINHSASELSADDIVTTLKAQSESREKPRRKKIIITGELPDYEALRAQEAERERLELERQAAQREAEEKAERERIAAEKEAAEQAEKARQARIKAEQERLEAERKAAEKAEKARIAAEKKAEAERARAERAAEKKRLKEQREAEKARRAEERRAAEEAERVRIAEEKRAAEEAEKARIEEEKAERERIAAEKAANETLNAPDNFSIEEIYDEPESSDNDAGNETESDEPKEVSGGFIEFFKHVLNEDPDEIINQRNDSPEKDDNSEPRKGSFKKTMYAVFGVIFAVFACIGLITVVAKGTDIIGKFNSGDSNRKGFEEFLYPAVIMDIDSFETPSELTSEQILTAAIWSMIMNDGITEQYELTFDVVIIPAADVEAYAVKLFGSELPELVHATVGPAESRFYYNEETKSYNVPVAPVTYTYSPEVRGATRSGDDYILVVDYIDELPEWLPKTSSKSVEFVITSTGDGYQLKSMKILSTSTNAV